MMNDSQKKNRTQNDRRNKQQLIKALEHSEELLENNGRDLSACQDALEQAQDKIAALGNLQQDLEAKEAELKQTEQLYVEMVEEANRLKQEIEKINKVNNDVDVSQLQTSLETQNAELKKNNAKLQKTECDLKRVKAELTKTKSKLRKANGQISQLRTDLKETANTASNSNEEDNRLAQEMEELRAILQNKTDEVNQLKKLLEERSNEATETLSNKEPDIEKAELLLKIDQLEKIVSALDKKLQDARSTSTRQFPEEKITKAAFRIDLYPRQDDIHGKIIHLLSNEKQAFTGLDKAAIVNFISNYLPQESSREKQETEIPPKPEIKLKRFPRLKNLQTVLDVSGEPSKVIYRDQPFNVKLSIDLADAALKLAGKLSYSAEIYAKPLSGGATKVLGGKENMIQSSGNITLKILPEALTPGIYRLWADVSLKEKESNLTFPVTPLPEINIMQVN